MNLSFVVLVFMQKYYLQVYALPLMEQLYSRKVSRHCYLSGSPSNEVWQMYFVGLDIVCVLVL